MINIQSQLKLAKWQLLLKRMTRISKYIDYYNNDYDSYILSVMRKQGSNQYLVLAKFIRKYPLTERLILDMSLVFKNGFTYLYNGSDRLKELLDTIIRKSNIKSYMSIVNKFVNLTNDVGVLPRYYNGKIILDIITPDKCIIKQVLGFPTLIELIYYFIDSSVDTSNSAYPVNTMYRITKDTISKVLIKTDGTIYNERLILTNPYGYIPVVWFKSELTYDSFWSSKLNPIILMHLYYVLAKSYEAMALMYQALATMITKGVPKDLKIPFGPMYWLNLPTNSTGLPGDADAKYITPDADFDALYAYSLQLLLQACTYAGLSALSFRRSAQFSSGYQLALSKSQLMDYNRMQKDMFIINMLDLFRIIIDTFNIYNALYNLSNIPVNIIIPLLSILYSYAELQAIALWELAHNIISLMDLLKKKYANLDSNLLLNIYNTNKALNMQSTL